LMPEVISGGHIVGTDLGYVVKAPVVRFPAMEDPDIVDHGKHAVLRTWFWRKAIEGKPWNPQAISKHLTLVLI
jgi:hypothetical protein